MLSDINPKCQIDEEGKFELKVVTSNTHLEFKRKYEMDLHEGIFLGRMVECEKLKKGFSYVSDQATTRK